MKYKTEWTPKTWGGELTIVNNEYYCGKILYVMKDYYTSLHYHKEKKESFWLYSGKIKLYYSDELDKIEKNLDPKTGLLTVGDDFSIKAENALEIEILSPGDRFEIPPGRLHKMLALENSQIFEFSTHHEESDSYRLIKGS